MDLSKKTLIGTIASLFLIALMVAVTFFLRADEANSWENKTTSALRIVFALSTIIFASITTFFFHRDGALTKINATILSSILLIAIFVLISNSIKIDMFNGNTTSDSAVKAFLTFDGLFELIVVPASAGAGYLISEL